jgi:hypothetical protein
MSNCKLRRDMKERTVVRGYDRVLSGGRAAYLRKWYLV